MFCNTVFRAPPAVVFGPSVPFWLGKNFLSENNRQVRSEKTPVYVCGAPGGHQPPRDVTAVSACSTWQLARSPGVPNRSHERRSAGQAAAGRRAGLQYAGHAWPLLQRRWRRRHRPVGRPQPSAGRAVAGRRRVGRWGRVQRRRAPRWRGETAEPSSAATFGFGRCGQGHVPRPGVGKHHHQHGRSVFAVWLPGKGLGDHLEPYPQNFIKKFKLFVCTVTSIIFVLDYRG